jgi:hypothetical protein
MLAIMLQGHFMHNLKFLHFDGRIELMSVLSALTIGLNLWLSILWAKQMGISGIILATAVSFGGAFIMSGILVLGRWMPLRKGARAVAG